MQEKYQIQYFDPEGNKHFIGIGEEGYEGELITINGYAELFYTEIGEILQPLRGQGLRIYLDADEKLNFSDLYSEKDRSFPVFYARNGEPLFFGWLDSENWFEDFVNDKWVVSFDCLDGLGYLEDLAYVQDTGLPYVGKERQSVILANALNRIKSPFLSLFMATDIDIFYEGLATDESILYNVHANQNRYIKDDGETIMSCAEVIRDILEPYGAILTRYGNYWLICKPNQIYNSDTLTCIVHEDDGIPQQNTITFNIDATINKYSEGLDKTLPHYAGGNQSIRNNKSYGAYRINYKYGLRQSLSDNPNFYTADGSTFDGWTVITPAKLTTNGADSYGAIFQSNLIATSIILESDPFTLTDDTVINVRFKFDISYQEQSSQFFGNFQYIIRLVDGGTTYYMNSVREWVTTVQVLTSPILGEGSGEVFTRSSPVPVDGDIYIDLLEPSQQTQIEGRGPTDYSIEMTEFVLSFDEDNTELLTEGEFHTFQRVSQPSAKIPDNKEVFTGDNETEIYIGALYKNDTETPTTTWFRKGVTEALPILRLMGEETMRINQSVSRVLSGGVYNYFPYISRVTLEGLDGVFMVTKYSYNTKDNTIQAEFKQIFGDELGADLFYELTFDYGNVVQPTIRG